uniref:WW domain-containing protein n=1 Tax=Glossina austeni TaxID=7395 RepID=A0A1A9UPG6_GLOAU
MSLPAALLQRLTQRGLVSKQKYQTQIEKSEPPASQPSEEEVIAEDYDEMETESPHQKNISEEFQYPSQYDLDHETVRKRSEDNYWLTQMKARMGEASSSLGYKGCPNKYNVWHKCTLYCVNRWAEGVPKPNVEYMKRYKRLLRKYPLPHGWVEMYDPGCGCYFFACEADNAVSWLPPTHPKSQITKCAATVRRQMEESTRDEDSDVDEQSDACDEKEQHESAQARHHREVEEIINASIRAKSPQNNNSLDITDFPSLEEASDFPTVALPRKQKSRDLDKAISKQRKDRERERHFVRRHNREETDVDPMDPSAYSDTPRGKWSDGLHPTDEGRKKKTEETKRSKIERESNQPDDEFSFR